MGTAREPRDLPTSQSEESHTPAPLGPDFAYKTIYENRRGRWGFEREPPACPGPRPACPSPRAPLAQTCSHPFSAAKFRHPHSAGLPVCRPHNPVCGDKRKELRNSQRGGWHRARGGRGHISTWSEDHTASSRAGGKIPGFTLDTGHTVSRVSSGHGPETKRSRKTTLSTGQHPHETNPHQRPSPVPAPTTNYPIWFQERKEEKKKEGKKKGKERGRNTGRHCYSL